MKTKKISDNLMTGSLYFYIHFITEVICFYSLARYMGDRPLVWLIFFTYDMMAFVPQSVIGYFSDRFPRVPLGAIGMLLMCSSLLMFEAVNPFVSLIVLCIGNCMVHVNGAEVTLRTAKGKLSGSAIFVSGGSFGVVTGKLLGSTQMGIWPLVAAAIITVPVTMYVQRYISDEEEPFEEQCREFDYARTDKPKWLIIALAVAIVAVRGYMGYGIPTSWNKTAIQTVMLFSFMGVGKAMGGIVADRIGVRRTAIISTVVAAPLLMAGDNIMVISLAGVMFFSMTMAITLAVLVSVLPRTPGLAFGWTTIGLFIGTAPVFFIRLSTFLSNCIMIATLSALCLVFIYTIIRKDSEDEQIHLASGRSIIGRGSKAPDIPGAAVRGNAPGNNHFGDTHGEII